MKLIHIAILALVQGAAELLPVSSSAHVIVAEKLLNLNPTTPEMTFLLVMLHTGTMFAVLLYFWPRWKESLLSPDHRFEFAKSIVIATVWTGVISYGLKIVLEKFILKDDIESLFGRLPLIALALFLVGLLIIYAGIREDLKARGALDSRSSSWIGAIQGLCLPFRGLSRSGATISAGLLQKISLETAEQFSFALAVVLTPPVIFKELHRLMKSVDKAMIQQFGVFHLVRDGLIGMAFSFVAGLIALRWLSNWLENGKWKYFGYYCIMAAAAVMGISCWKG